MINRYKGTSGQRLLIDAILQQPIIYGKNDIATKLAPFSELISYDPGQLIIKQDDTDNDLYLIVVGQVSVVVHGREVAQRTAGEHVGEMSLIDPMQYRSASIIALKPCVVAKLSEELFSGLAIEYPELWRGIARELGNRLRQRNNLVRQKNEKPRIFIGSSSESFHVAERIQARLESPQLIVTTWKDHVFGPSKYFLEPLQEQVKKSDFAVLVIGPDDKVISRDKESDAPRDNVVFELGLFIGALGRERVFMVTPKNIDVKIPSDLLGLNPLSYTVPTDIDDLPSRLGPVCIELKDLVIKLGSR
jgi:CRP/FNR family transcriptional regulator, cyclic AMP receptor protein